MNKVCIICGTKFTTNHPRKKTCSNTCSKENQRRYSKKYYNTPKGKTNILNAVKKYSNKNKEKIKSKAKKYRLQNQELTLTSEQLKKLEELAKRQQIIPEYEFKTHGICPICGKKKKLLEHHISYIPPEKIFMCHKCHSILHNRFLNGIKCRPEKQKK